MDMQLRTSKKGETLRSKVALWQSCQRCKSETGQSALKSCVAITFLISSFRMNSVHNLIFERLKGCRGVDGGFLKLEIKNGNVRRTLKNYAKHEAIQRERLGITK
ncbi:hypothetical protein POVCU2_0000850 [Plasmodium ovale curtisi]|uniref:Uncharacterized protein n=1 Tax=Plasmodium ovale curtisi TaxID=864141 RepID=A0A1A8VIB3_PLAOA|nr:hypothetical protein POVCU2_0000850 [Plasmodium ovale curtisi]SBS80427.1 hypothetical protein POVCU1_000890 [Plasmodium ovale curtisi]